MCHPTMCHPMMFHPMISSIVPAALPGICHRLLPKEAPLCTKLRSTTRRSEETACRRCMVQVLDDTDEEYSYRDPATGDLLRKPFKTLFHEVLPEAPACGPIVLWSPGSHVRVVLLIPWRHCSARGRMPFSSVFYNHLEVFISPLHLFNAWFRC